MTPENVRASLVEPPDPPPLAFGGLPPGKADDVLASISASYFRLRRGMAVIALAFPLLLWAGGGLADLQGSISAYYHSDGDAVRTVFVGVLWAIGSFLYFYKGYSRAEDLALDGAGAAAVAVSLFPVDWPPCRADPADPEAVCPALSATGHAHYVAAILFFLLIAYVCVFRSRDTLALLRDEARRRRFQRAYGILGAAMVAAPLLVWLIDLAFPASENSRVVFVIEAVGIYVFASFWLVKSREIAILEGR